MMKLIQIEWMKFRRSATVISILAIYAVILPTMYWLLAYLEVGPFRIPIEGYQFPDTYHLSAWCASWFNLIVGVIIIVFTTNELKYKTQRQNVIDGLKKSDIIISKFLLILGLSLMITLYTFLVALVTGLFNGGGNFIFDGVEYMGVYFVSTLGYFSFAFFFANLVRLPALAIVIYIFSRIIESIVGLIAVQEYAQFFPLSTFANLVKFPLQFWVAPRVPEYMMTTTQATLLALLYISLFVLSAYWIIKRRDI